MTATTIRRSLQLLVLFAISLAFLIQVGPRDVSAADSEEFEADVVTDTNAAADGLAQNLVTNGSFEEPVIGLGTFALLPSIPGWTLFKGQFIEVQSGDHWGTPAAGSQLVELDSTESSGIFQDVPTQPGLECELSFAFSARPEFGGPTENHLQVRWDGELVADLTADGTALTDTDWSYHIRVVTASDTITRLDLEDVGLSNGAGTYIDDVSVVCSQPSVGGSTSFLASGSGSFSGGIALLAGGLVAVLAIAAGVWYTRRSWRADRS